jgi:cysteine desulfurase
MIAIIYYFGFGGTIFLEIYLDNAATTKPVLEATLAAYMEDGWYNPSCAYAPAARIFSEMKKARELLLELTGARGDCIFTSGGTEANNFVIMSAFRPNAHYVTSAIEHPSVYNAFKQLEAMGAEVDYIKPAGFGIRAEDVAGAVRKNTALVSIMNVNNETGALNDIKAIARAVKSINAGAYFHSDGVQALFKTAIDLFPDVDYYTVSAHKIHALKGTGAVLTNGGASLKRLLYGGEQEYTLRPGTENTLGILAFGEALRRGRDNVTESVKRVEALQRRLLGHLEGMPGAHVNLPESKVPHIVNVSFPGVRAEVLVRVLGEKGVYIGTGAACSRGKVSRVLLESGLSKELAEGAVRISMSGMNTEADIDICAEELDKAAGKLRTFGRR